MIRQVAGWSEQRLDRAALTFLAIAAYVPMILTRPGRVSADTKTYLTLDPADVVTTASSMWDPSVGAGTVPHQNIGYLFPLGPYYWVMEAVGIPDWLTQRLLWATMVFAAAAGAFRLARWLGWTTFAAVVPAFTYAFTPYLLSYLARLSVILAPWAAMPWLILLAARAARTRSWRPAAWFALVVALVGSVNATSLVLAGLGPAVWLTLDVVSQRVSWRHAVAAVARIAVLTVPVSAWWIAGLRAQGSFGLPILRYTETYQSVASASTPAELLRGLGYWFFYGSDRLDPWVGPSAPYADHPAVMALGFGLAGVGLLGLLVSFPGRARASALLVVGLVVAVGAAPLGDSTLYGTLFETFATETTAGQALRSTPRAAPLVVLALAFGLGNAVAVTRRRLDSRGGTASRWSPALPLAAGALVAVQLLPWFTGTALTPSLLRDETLPAHQRELADWLDRTGDGRVYELPAADFANYRWGGTVDPVLPGLIDRPYLARELVPQGGDGTANLLNALERRLGEGWFEPESLTPVGLRFDVATVAVRNDLEHERYRLARPGPLWTDLVAGLGEPDHAGPLVEDRPEIPMLDELTLAHPDAAEEFPVVAAFDLQPAPVVSTQPGDGPIVLAGDGDGVVDLAGADLLDPARTLLYAPTLDALAEAGELDAATLGDAPWWVITDTNRRQGRRWSTVSSNLGALETEQPVQLEPDPGDNRLELFDDDIDQQTVAVHRGDVADVRASYYGNRIAYTPEDAPWFALDGDPSTAWRAGVFDSTDGLIWEVDLNRPADPGEITILQPVTGAVGRFITELRITLDGDTSLDVALDERSREVPGQRIPLPPGPFRSLRLEVLADSLGDVADYAGQPGVGLAEVSIPGVDDDRVVRLPDPADNAAFPDPAELPLTYVFTRQRIDPATPNRSSPEPHLAREFSLPVADEFDLVGEARVSAAAHDAVLAELLGRPSDVVADRRLPGSPASWGPAAVDGDIDTAWQTPFDAALGAALTIDRPLRAAQLDVTWWDDGQHSVPTELTLTSGDGSTAVVALPGSEPDAGRATATVPLDGWDADRTVLTITGIDERTSPEYFSGVPQVLPVALAEIAFGAPNDAPPERPSEECRDDLLRLDGRPLPVRLRPDAADALARDELRLEACQPLELAAGVHRLDAVPGSSTGLDLDRLVLDRDVPRAAPPTPPAPSEIDRHDETSLTVRLPAGEEPAWLTLNESWNPGWRATVDGERGERSDLGEPILVDGYANGWLLPPADTPRTVELRWTPQRSVDVALWISLLGGLATVAILVLDRRRRPVEAPRPGSSSWRSHLISVAGLALVLAVVAGPLAAVVGGAVALLARRRRRTAERLAAAVVLAAGAVVAVTVIAQEWRYDFPTAPDWPDRWGWLSPLVWTMVAAVAGVGLVGRHEDRPAATDAERDDEQAML